MTWNEQDHPRDEEGKFTNKEGGGSKKETVAQILYGDKSRKDREEMELRNSLLNELGDKLTPAQILYSSVDDLKKIKEEELKKNFKGELTKMAGPIGLSNNQTEQPKPKAKLLPKIPIELQIEETVCAKIAPDDWDKQENKLNNIKSKHQSNGIFSLEDRQKARKFIHGSEGFSDVAYQDTAGVWTIGYGHTGLVNGKPITKDMKISKEEAEELYRKDFENHIAPLKDIKTPLTRNQQIALASLMYNVGPGVLKETNLRKKLDAGDIEGAASEFDKYIRAKNKKTGEKEILKGLVNRRKREKELFLKPDEEL